jgi:hypothetical protein
MRLKLATYVCSLSLCRYPLRPWRCPARIARNLSGWDQLGGGRSEAAPMLALFVKKLLHVMPVLLYLKVVDIHT